MYVMLTSSRGYGRISRAQNPLIKVVGPSAECPCDLLFNVLTLSLVSGENSVPFRELSVREPVHPHVRDFDLQ